MSGNNIDDISETIASLQRAIQDGIVRKDFQSAQLLQGVLQELYPKPTLKDSSLDPVEAQTQHRNTIATFRIQQAKLFMDMKNYNSALQLMGSLTYFALNAADNPLEAMAAENEQWAEQARKKEREQPSIKERRTGVAEDSHEGEEGVTADDEPHSQLEEEHSDEILQHLVGFENPSSNQYKQIVKLRKAVRPRCSELAPGTTPCAGRVSTQSVGGGMSTIRRPQETSTGFACTQPFDDNSFSLNRSHMEHTYGKGGLGGGERQEGLSVSSLSELLPPEMSTATNIRCEALQVASEACLQLALIPRCNIYTQALIALFEAEEEVIRSAIGDMGQLVVGPNGVPVEERPLTYSISSAVQTRTQVSSAAAAQHQQLQDVLHHLEKRLAAIMKRKVEPFMRIAKAAEAVGDCEKASSYYRFVLMIDPCAVSAMEALQKKHLLKPAEQVELIQSLDFPAHLEVIRSMYLLQVPVTTLPAAADRDTEHFPSVGRFKNGPQDVNMTGPRDYLGSELDGTFFIPNTSQHPPRGSSARFGDHPTTFFDEAGNITIQDIASLSPVRPATVTIPITAEGDDWLSASSHGYHQHAAAQQRLADSVSSRAAAGVASPQPHTQRSGIRHELLDEGEEEEEDNAVGASGNRGRSAANRFASAAPSSLRDISAVAPTPNTGNFRANAHREDPANATMTIRALSLQSNQTIFTKPSLVGPSGIEPSAPVVPIDGIPMSVLLSRQARLEQSRNDLGSMLVTTTQLHNLYPHDRAALCLHLLALVETRSHAKLFQLGHVLQHSRPYSEVAVYAIGCYYYARSEFEKAGRYFAKATDIDASFAEAWVVLGHCYATLQEGEHALSVYRRAMNMFPGLAECATFFGVQQIRTLSARSAKASLQGALLASPYDPLILNELGTLAVKERDYAEAVRCLTGALSLLPNMEEPSPHHDCILFNLGLAYRRSKNYPAALHFFDMYRRNCPNAAHAHCALGVTYHLMGSLKVAIESYHTSLSISPDTFCRQALEKVLHEEYTNASQATPSGILTALSDNILMKPEALNPHRGYEEDDEAADGAPHKQQQQQQQHADPSSTIHGLFNFSSTVGPRGPNNNTTAAPMGGGASFLSLGGGIGIGTSGYQLHNNGGGAGSVDRHHTLYTPGSGMSYNGSEDRASRPQATEGLDIDGVPARRRRNYAMAPSAVGSDGLAGEGRGLSMGSATAFGPGITLDFASQQRPSSQYAASAGRRSLPSTEFAHRALDLTTATASDSMGPSPTQQLRFTGSGRYSAFIGGSVPASTTTSMASQHNGGAIPAAPRHGSMGIDRSSTSPSGSASGHYLHPSAPASSTSFLRGSQGAAMFGGTIPSPSAMLLMEGMRDSGQLFFDPSTPMPHMGGGGSLARSSGGTAVLRASTGAATVLRGSGGTYSRGMAPSAERPSTNYNFGGRRMQGFGGEDDEEDNDDDVPSTAMPMLGRNSATMPGPPQ